MEAWAGGDRAAGVDLVERHYDMVFGFFAHRLGDEEAAELTQETFTGLTEALGRFRRHSSVRTFIFAIARWKLVEHQRRRISRRERFVPLSPGAQERVPTAASPVVALEGRRRESLLVVALRSLPLDDQILLELKGYEELSLRELGEVFGVPTGTVASRVRRARERLTRAIQQIADDPQLAEETVTGIDTYMRALRDRSAYPV